MKQKGGNLGKLRGLNLEKARMSNIKTAIASPMVDIQATPFEISANIPDTSLRLRKIQPQSLPTLTPLTRALPKAPSHGQNTKGDHSLNQH